MPYETKHYNMKNSEKSAYPVESQSAVSSDYHGLTKREYFAAMAMQGILSANSEWLHGNVPLPIAGGVAELSIKLSDELLKQLES